MQWWEPVLAVAGGLALLYALMLLALWGYARRHPDTIGKRDALRLLPDLLRLLRRLAADPELRARTRLLPLLLLAYLASPIDLVPDFVPVLGYADDVLVAAWLLRAMVRSAGPDTLRAHWPGTEAGLDAVERLAGVDQRRRR
ncbi:MAG: YkvA family protein [Actinomycetota bacterium]